MNRSAPLKVLALLCFAGSYAWSADAGDVLHRCAAIDADNERLACYDKLAGRVSQPPRSSGAEARSQPPAALPADGRAASQPAGGGAPTTSPDKPLTKETFGLYSSEHPTAPKGYPELTAAVTRVASDPSGLMLVYLEGGQLWRIEGADPLLAKGDAVNIKRAKLGSFLMSTPGGRVYRAQRLK
jgi:hypothetical protein